MEPGTTGRVKMLLSQIRDGDEAAFTVLFDLYRPRVYTTALRITKNEWAAEEILQDTFVQIWKNRVTLDQIDNFEGWVYTVARNITFNELKRMERERSNYNRLVQDTVSLVHPGADAEMHTKEFQQLLYQAIARLPEKQKLTYQLIKEQHLKRDEVATRLHVSPETVKWNLDQAMRSIRAYCSMHMKGLPVAFILHFLKYF